MDIKTDLPNDQLKNWNNKIRKAYWLIFILTIVCGLSAWPFIARDVQESVASFIRTSLILQNSILLAIMIVTELIFRMRTRIQDYLMIAVGAGFSTTIFSLMPTYIYGAQVVMLIPILISTLYLSYRKVLFAGLLTLTIYFVLILTLPGYQDIPEQQISLVICSIIICTFLVLVIVGRGLDIMREEESILLEEDSLISQQLSMDKLVRKDALTGLDNHRAFQERLVNSVEQGKEEGITIHLAILDIDNFKKVNDNYGHWTGDIVLRRMGTLLGDNCNEDVYASRYGGEEFAVIFMRMEDDEVTEWLENLLNRLALTEFTEMDGQHITISVGCHRMHPDDSKEDLFRITDEALYSAKRQGKNRIVWDNTPVH